MIAARDLNPDNPSDQVLIGGSWYGVAEHTSDDRYVLAHTCPDGTVLTREADPWDEFWTAGERLAELRGEAVEIALMIEAVLSRRQRSRLSLFQTTSSMEYQELRWKQGTINAQIDELVLMGVSECVMLGAERCGVCHGSSYERAGDPCPACAGSGLSDV